MAGGGLALLLLALLGAHAAALQSFNDTTLPGCAAQVNHVSFTKQTYDFGLAPGCPQFAKSLLPHHFYSKPKDASPSPRPGGVAVASLIDASGAVVCTGALVSDQHVLTSLGCALLLRGDNGTAGNYTGGRMVRIGNETYSVVQEMLDPRGRHEELALLTLDRTTPYAAVPMDDGGHIGSPGSAECNSLATELVSPADGPSFAAPWELFDPSLMHDSPLVFPGYHFVYSDLHETCRYKGGNRQQSGMCGTGTKGMGGAQALLGSPILAFARKDGRQRAVLAGIVTAQLGRLLADVDLIARVSDARQWILAATGTAVFPAVKLIAEIEESTGNADLHVYLGGQAAHKVEACDAFYNVTDAGTGWMTVMLSARDPNNTEGGRQEDATPHARVSVRKVGCPENFEGKRGEAACADPRQGRVRGCAYSWDETTGREACHDPECVPSVSWTDVRRRLQATGKAWVGGMGLSAVRSAHANFDTWMCMRDWAPEEQLACGLGIHEIGCFYFEDVSNTWHYKGSNVDLKMVRDEWIEAGFEKERSTVRALSKLFPLTWPDDGVACPAGTYKGSPDASGATTCTGCPSGATSPGGSTAASACICAAGFTPSSGAGGDCTPCPAGSYKGVVGEAACVACGIGYASPAAASACACAVGYAGGGGSGCTPVFVSFGDVSVCVGGGTRVLRCWGFNNYGQLGDNSTSDRHSPVDVLGLGGTAVAAAAGYGHACAILDGGSLTCWGKNSQGQLGVGDTDNNLSPAVVGLGGTAVAVAVGYGHSCAILDGGAVKCWGSNFNGKLGSGTSGDKHTPVLVVMGGLAAVALAVRSSGSCAILDGGSLTCWGTRGGGGGVPVVVAMGGAAVALAVGVSHACAILDGGSLKCWGSNTQGELGDSTTTDSTTPVDVDLGGTAVAVAVGSLHSCAILDGGAVKCWGKNTEGQLGVGDTTDRLSPVVVDLNGTAVAVAAGDVMTCAILDGGSLKCWGTNSYGTYTGSSFHLTPELVPGF